MKKTISALILCMLLLLSSCRSPLAPPADNSEQPGGTPGVSSPIESPSMEPSPDVSGEPSAEPDPSDEPVRPIDNDPPANSTLSIVDAVVLGASKAHNVHTVNRYYVTGTVTAINNETYGNMFIADEAGNTLYIYGTYDAHGDIRYDSMSTKPAVGDTVTVYGVIGQYNGYAQMKNGWITAHISALDPEPSTEPEPSVTSAPDGACAAHADQDDNGLCDQCGVSVLVIVDFFGINDLHGKVPDGDNHPGVDELTTYLKNQKKTNDHVVLFSVGDMWQGTAESNLTQGNLVTDWMSEMDFVAMTLGNHEFDWGEDAVRDNGAIAEFPFLAINIYNRSTNRQAEYCQSSVVVECGGVQIGIIGAMGDCYSSISAEQTKNIYFKTGSELTALVKNESEKLQNAGADFIVYLIHDGLGQSASGTVSTSQLRSYYDVTLSDGYVDIVFEGHSHQRYVFRDEKGVYHIQGGGDNKGITHAEVQINSANGNCAVNTAETVTTGAYSYLEDDPLVEELMQKYAEEISPSARVLGTNSRRRSSDSIRKLVADMYYQAGMERWGDQYDIVLGGGLISVRAPYSLMAGEVTYGDLQGLLPFDNDLVLCSVSGRNLKSKFFESTHSSYAVSYGDYGASVRSSIDPNATYYIIVDTYTSTYAPNGLTEIARYTPGVYARDLLADYIAAGGLR